MKYCFLAALLLIATWWHIASDQPFSEQRVAQFYQHQQELMQARQADALCASLDPQFQSRRFTRWEDEDVNPLNQGQTCTHLQQMAQEFANLEYSLGGSLPIECHYTIHRIELAEDEQSMVVEVSYTLTAVGALKTISGHSRDTLIHQRGKTMILQREILA